MLSEYFLRNSAEPAVTLCLAPDVSRCDLFFAGEEGGESEGVRDGADGVGSCAVNVPLRLLDWRWRY